MNYCPNCRMPLFINRGDCIEYGCGAMYLGDKRLCGNPSCDEIARLNERVRVLEDAIELAMQQHGRAEISESQRTLYEALNALVAGKDVVK